MPIARALARRVASGALILVFGCGTQTSGDGAGAAPADSPAPPSPGLTEPPPKETDGTVMPPGEPVPVEPSDEFAPSVVWKRDELIVTAYGSSSCPPVATAAAVVEPQTLLISFRDLPEQACTDDYAPHTSRVPAPSGDVDRQRRVHAVFDLEGSPRWLVTVHVVRPPGGAQL